MAFLGLGATFYPRSQCPPNAPGHPPSMPEAPAQFSLLHSGEAAFCGPGRAPIVRPHDLVVSEIDFPVPAFRGPRPGCVRLSSRPAYPAQSDWAALHLPTTVSLSDIDIDAGGSRATVRALSAPARAGRVLQTILVDLRPPLHAAVRRTAQLDSASAHIACA